MSRLMKDIFEEFQLKQVQLIREKRFNELGEMSWQIQEMLNQDAENPSLMFLLGTCYLNLGCYASSIVLFEAALKKEPDLHEAYNNLGAAWKQLHRVDKAKVALKKALSFKESPEALNNMATLFINGGNPAEGIPYAERSIAMAKAGEMPIAQPRWNLGLLQLELGLLKEGFENFDYGLFSGDRVLKAIHCKNGTLQYWDGKPGKKLIVYDEQGLGDRIMFANLLREVLKTNEVIMECHPRLEGMYRRCFPEILEIYPTAKDESAEWHVDAEADAFVATGSLPRFYWKSYEDVDRSTYVTPDLERVERFKRELREAGPGPYIGIGWRGGVHKTHAMDRSMKLGWLMDKLPEGPTYVSLQYTSEAGEKIEKYNEGNPNKKIIRYPFVEDGHSDYDETIALVAALDLCLVPNTTIVHLCGAMGKPCWTWTPFRRAWRYYGPDKDHMAWYGDHVRQFHQPLNMDREEWLNSIRRAFDEWLREIASPSSNRDSLNG